MNNKNTLIKIVENKTQWEDAIKIGVDLLVNNDIATHELADEIIKSTKNLGPYYILAPRFALAHVQPGKYNKGVGISIVLFKEAVNFSQEQRHDVNLLFTLSTTDQNAHVEKLSKVAMLFNNSNIVDDAMKCNTIEELFDLFKGVM